jgi:hypothetical protein
MRGVDKWIFQNRHGVPEVIAPENEHDIKNMGRAEARGVEENIITG